MGASEAIGAGAAALGADKAGVVVGLMVVGAMILVTIPFAFMELQRNTRSRS